jgi:hypothetical protein
MMTSISHAGLRQGCRLTKYARRLQAASGALATAALLQFATLVQSATSALAQPSGPMTIGLVRAVTPGCDPRCPEFIAMQGIVQPDSHEKLKFVLDQLRGQRRPIIISSPGGNVDSAMQIAQMIRARRLDVGVARATFAEICRDDDDACARNQRGKPPGRTLAFENAFCASACTIIIAGGIKRVMAANARIGVHQMSSMATERVIDRVYETDPRTGARRVVSEELVSETTQRETDAARANRGVAKHFADMGVGPSFVELTLTTPSDQLRILTPGEMMDTRIATHTSDLLRALGLSPP